MRAAPGDLGGFLGKTGPILSRSKGLRCQAAIVLSLGILLISIVDAFRAASLHWVHGHRSYRFSLFMVCRELVTSSGK